MKTNLKEPCKACPFRRVSIAGWLGPWQPHELLWSIKSVPFPCHKTIKEDTPFDSPEAEKMELCAGAAIYLNNTLTLSRDPETAAYQRKMKELHDGASVFATAHEFIEHHTLFRNPLPGAAE